MSTIDEQMSILDGLIHTLTNLSLDGLIHIALQDVLSEFLDTKKHKDVLSAMGFETFFTQTREAHFWAAFVCFSKLFDPHKDAVSIYKFSNSAESNASKFQYASKDDVLNRIKCFDDWLDLRKPEIEKLKTQRDKFLAHHDPKVSKMTSDERLINTRDITMLFNSAVSFLDDLFQYRNGCRRIDANLVYSNAKSAKNVMNCLLQNASNEYQR